MNALETLAADVPNLKQSFDPTIVFGGLTQYTLWMIIIFAIVCIVVLTAARKVTLVPTSKFVNMVEYGYEFVRQDMGENAIGRGYEKHMSFLATLFFFILIANFIGLIPGCKTPTGSLSVTWALAAISFVYFNYYGIKTHGGWGYIKSIAPSGLPIALVPIIWFFEMLSLLLRVLTLAVRLYGNMFAGHMVLGIFALATSVFIGTAIQNMDLVVSLPSIGWFALLLCMYALETLFAFIQAYVFTILSAVYIGLASAEH
ncbi:MAG: F0F1 ATP synthase subunit A [Eggerthellaceae bacterium]|nr:F0F1 ATP synthase subunit A [Eggerthellaceae bacterium]